MARKWLHRSRLWRFIFLQRKDGSFACTPGLALALNAHTEDDNDENDDPLTCQVEAIVQSMPEIVIEGHGGTPEEVEELRMRVWATTLAIVALEKLPFSWLADEARSAVWEPCVTV